MRQAQILAALMPLLMAGCSFSVVSDDRDFDPDLARETLLETLDAWKNGDAQLLVQLSPPIRFVDDDFVAGFQLVDYEYGPSGRPVRPFQGVPVTLTLQRGNGNPFVRQAQYQISLDPLRAVLRSDP